MKAGQMLLIEQALIHRFGPNHSGDVRVAAMGMGMYRRRKLAWSITIEFTTTKLHGSNTKQYRTTSTCIKFWGKGRIKVACLENKGRV
jgi:hypothetical protein